MLKKAMFSLQFHLKFLSNSHKNQYMLTNKVSFSEHISFLHSEINNSFLYFHLRSGAMSVYKPKLF